MNLTHLLTAHAGDVIQALTLIALLWYATETRLIRKEDHTYHRSERRIDYYFHLQREEQPTETDLIRFVDFPKPRQADAVATLANLGKIALLVKGLTIRCRPMGKRDYTLPPVVLGPGTSVQFIVADLIVRYLHESGLISDSAPAERQSWSGELEVCLQFYSRGMSRTSESQRYAVGISFNAVQSIHFIRPNDDEESARLTKSALAG